MKKEKRTITVYQDPSCDMATVKVDKAVPQFKRTGMTGNYWDFHPGCHGIMDFGEFKGHMDLAYRVKGALEKAGYTVELVVHENAIYNEATGAWRL